MSPLQFSEQTGYIKLLKKKLKEHNYFKGEVNGQFDIDVRNAIMELQHDHGLALTGIIDDKVLEVLLNPSHVSISKEEYTSNDVIILEMKLKKVGPSEEVKEHEKVIEKKQIPRPQETMEKKLWEMFIPQEGIEEVFPPLLFGEETYIVKQGDTLWSIAKRFHTTVEEIMLVNGLHNTLLSIGQKLIVPGNLDIEQISNIYTVKQGDNLWAISRKFGTTVEEIMEVNNLTSINLSIGQQLLIPTAHQEIVTYIVQKGDNLWAIAKRFGTTVNDLKKINRLQNDLLNIGQELIISM